MSLKKVVELIPSPVTKFRDAVCEVHGPHREMGGSLTGRKDALRWFGCSLCNKASRELEKSVAAAASEAQRQKRVEGYLKAAGIPLAFMGRNFGNYVVETEAMGNARSIAIEFAETFWTRAIPDGLVLVFGGGTGTGKSHLALAVAQTVLKRGTAMYMDVADLIQRVRGTWRRDSDRSEESMMGLLASIDLLVIDEVGVQRGTADEQNTLTDIINRRYRDMRPTILLTNLPGDELIELLGPRVMSRLTERATFVTFDWQDWRMRGRK